MVDDACCAVFEEVEYTLKTGRTAIVGVGHDVGGGVFRKVGDETDLGLLLRSLGETKETLDVAVIHSEDKVEGLEVLRIDRT